MPIHPLPVRYVDNHLLVVEKPAGMLSQADRTGDEDVLTASKAWVGERFNKPGAVYMGLVHRLDRPASGLMVLARTSKAASRLTDQFRSHTVEKRYFAWVQGQPPPSDSLKDWLFKEDEHARVVPPGTPGGKEARLSYEVIHRFDASALVVIRLQTGRPHQVRLQFSSRGFPLVGDLRYGATEILDGQNLALHAAALALDHPTRKERLGWTAPPDGRWPAEIRLAGGSWLEKWQESAGFPVNPASP